MNKQQIIAIAQEKQRENESLYIVFDGACENNAVRHLFSFVGVEEYCFLYSGTPYESVMEYGPVLATVSAPSPFLSWFWDNGPDIYAGIALFSPLHIAALAEQLQTVLTIMLPNGHKAFFRFYDPRLIKTAINLSIKNGETSLTRNISTHYAPIYTFGNKIEWEKVVVMEHRNG